MQFLRVNMDGLNCRLEPVPTEYNFLGGRALTGKLLLDEVQPDCDPLSGTNKLIIAPGLLGGTQVPCSGRLSIGAKSPLTGGIKEANAGGTSAQKLARMGIKAVIVEGKAPQGKFYSLEVTDKGAQLVEETDLLGLDNYKACEAIHNKHGRKIGIILAGAAGEKGYPMATIAVTDPDGIPARHAARGGLGSVMASKGLKAIIIDDAGRKNREAQDSKFFKSIAGEWAKGLAEGKKALTKFGTAVLVNVINEVGGLATRNFSVGSFEGAASINGEALAETISKRGGDPSHACQPGCPIRCSNVYVDANGQHVTSSLEFETIALNGSNLGISDLDVIARIDRFCDDFGVDTIELGCSLGVAMEAGVISFGNAEDVFGILSEMSQGTVTGRLIAQGAATCGRVLGVSRIPAVKGQGLAAYDPRALKGTGVTYATSPMGSDHTAGNCLPGRVGYRPETENVLDTGDAQGQVNLSIDNQVMHAVCDAMGLCIFVGAAKDTMFTVAQLMTAFYGQEFSFEDIINLGKDVIRVELQFNRGAGITDKDNKLPEYFRTEPLAPHGRTFDIEESKLQNIFAGIEPVQ